VKSILHNGIAKFFPKNLAGFELGTSFLEADAVPLSHAMPPALAALNRFKGIKTFE
jgi:hypothetical protein